MIDFKKYLTEQSWNIPSGARLGRRPITSSQYSDLSGISGPIGGFYKPDGMAAMGTDPDDLKHPDPTVSGKSIDDVIDGDLYDVLKQEWVLYGKDGLYINGDTARALRTFTTTSSYDDLFARGKTRWGVRPPIINWLTGGVEDSYHKTGHAVDLKLKIDQRSITYQQLTDCVWNALYSGFRGIGFGGGQFHFDTRDGGMLGYTYDKWWTSTGPADVLKSAFESLANIASEKGDARSESFYREAARKVNTSVTVLPDNTGKGYSGPRHFSGSDIDKYINRSINAEQEGIGASPTSAPSSSSATRTYTSTSDTSTRTYTPSDEDKGESETPYLLTKAGRGDLVTLGILGAVILGGFYGFRSFLRHMKNRSERAKYEREIRRLLSQKSRRELIGEFRMKHSRAIVRAKRDPRLARELEFKLAKILADNGYPIY